MSANEIRTRNAQPFDFVDGLKVKGLDLNTDGASVIGFHLADSDTQVTILLDWIRSVAAILKSGTGTGGSGDGTSPTQPLTDSSTKNANTEFVQKLIALKLKELVPDSTPKDLNTLQKIAAAINNDAGFYKSIKDLIDGKIGISAVRECLGRFQLNEGTSDALRANFTPAVTALSDGLQLYVRAREGNATKAPTFTPNAVSIAGLPIVKGGGAELEVGDIVPNSFLHLSYSDPLKSWILLNPAIPVALGWANDAQAREMTATKVIMSPAAVKVALATVLGNAPAGLRTLEALAKAIGNDADFVNTLHKQMESYAPLKDPMFTGDVTVPTRALFDIGNTAASTRWVVSYLTEALTKISISQASEQVVGVTRYATLEELKAGTADAAAVTPKNLLAWFDARRATSTVAGILPVATGDQAYEGVIDTAAITPKTLKAALEMAFDQYSGVASGPTSPAMTGGSTVIVGLTYSLTLSATATTAGATISSFDVSVNGAAVQTVLAVSGSATFNWVSSGLVGSTATLTAIARDSNNKVSAASTKTIQLTTITVNTPSILSPTSGATNVNRTPTLTCSAVSASGGTATLTSIEWEIRTAPMGGGVAVWTGSGTSTAITLPLASALQPGQTYYVRVRHNTSNAGVSSWGESSFTVVTAPQLPVLSSPTSVINGSTLALAMSSAATASGASISNFLVSVNGGAAQTVQAVNGAATFNWVASGANGAVVTFSVQAVDTNGSTSPAATRQATIVVVLVNTPSFISPTDGTTGVSVAPLLKISPLSLTGAAAANHVSTDWEIRTAAGGQGTLVDSSLVNQTSKESYQVPAGKLSNGTKYFARALVRDQNYGASSYGEVSFTTAVQAGAPVVTLPSGFLPGASVAVTLSATPQSPATSISSFLVSINGGSEIPVAASGNSGSTTVAASVTSLIAPGGSLSVAVRALDNTGAYSSTANKTSTAVKVNAPTITSPSASAVTSLTPTAISAALSLIGGTDTLESTSWQVVNTSTGAVVWSVDYDVANLLQITVPAAKLSHSTAYKLRARHTAKVYRDSAWSEVAFTTMAQPAAPTLSGAASVYVGSAYSLGMSATVTAPATSVTSFEVSVDGVVVATPTATNNAASYSWPATESAKKTAGSNAIITVVAIDNTNARSVVATKSVAMTGLSVNAPVILSPTASAVGVSRTATLTTQAMTVVGGTSTHLSTDWTLTRVSDGAVVWSSLGDTTNKTSITIPAGKLAGGVAYRLAVKFTSTSAGSSPASTVDFTTVQELSPSLSGADVWYLGSGYLLTVAASATAPATAVTQVTYSVNGGAAKTVASSSTGVSLSLTTAELGSVAANTPITLRVTYTNDAGGISAEASKTVTVKSPTISQPVITAPTADQTGVQANPTLTTQAMASVGGAATHKATSWSVVDFGTTNVVWSSPNDTTNKIGIAVPAGKLLAGAKYTLSVVHHSVEYGDSLASLVNFTVKAAVAGPVLRSTLSGVLAGGVLDVAITAAAVAPATSVLEAQYWFDSGAALSTTVKVGSGFPVQIPATVTTGKAAGTAVAMNARTRDDTGAWSLVTNRIYRVNNVVAPTMVAPTAAQTGVSGLPTLKSSAFSVVADVDTHVKTDWVITSDKPFSDGGTVVYQSLANTVDLTSHTLPAASRLTAGQSYYVQARHYGTTYGESLWGAAVQFTVGALAAPVVTNPTNGATGVSKTVTLAITLPTSPVSGDTIDSVDWEIWSAVGRTGTLLWSSLADAVNKTSIAVPAGKLTDNTTYYLATRATSKLLGNGSYSATSFKTSGELVISQLAKAVAQSGTVLKSYAGDGFGESVALARDTSATARYAVGSSIYDYFDATVVDSGLVEFGTFTPSTAARTNRTTITGQSNPGELLGGCVALSGDGTKQALGWPLNTVPGSTYFNTGRANLYNYAPATGLMSTPSGTLGSAYLAVSDMRGYQYFGNAVALSSDGRTVAVGCFRWDGTSDNLGAVYIYEYNTTTALYVLQATLTPTTVDSDEFGYDLDLSDDGNTLVVSSAMADTATGYDGGCFYVFKRSGTTWTQKARIIPSDATGTAMFAWSIAISGDGRTIAAGSPWMDVTNPDDGAVHIFVDPDGSGTVWNQQAKIACPDVASGTKFGNSVALTTNGSKLIVGAPGVANSTGKSYVFNRTGTTWAIKGPVAMTTAVVGSNFGASVDILGDGTLALIGAPGTTTVAGAVYFFQV